MADAGAVLRALGLMASQAQAAQASPTGQPLPAGPRGANSYMGVQLPVGLSSLKASSQDSRGKRVRTAKALPEGVTMPPDSPENKKLNTLMKGLFQMNTANGWPMPQDDAMADQILDQSGFFDDRDKRPYKQRRNDFIDLWLKLFRPRQ